MKWSSFINFKTYCAYRSWSIRYLWSKATI